MRRGGERGTEPSTGGAADVGEPAAGASRVQGSAPPGVTPSMAQFLEIKAAHPGCLLFYRMGDFYELFFDDAVTAAEALGIVLTKRGKHLGEDIPMCGVPVHRADEYLQRLIASGFRVAVCEQMEDPAAAKKRGSKAVVHRDVVRLVTPGTLTEDSLLDAKACNYLTAIFAGPDRAGGHAGTGGHRGGGRGEGLIALASLDISTGELEVGEVARADFAGEIVRLGSSEVIASDVVLADADIDKGVALARCAATPVPAATFDSLAGERQLKAGLGVADLAAFGALSRRELAAVGALLKYVELTQIGRRPCLRPPRRSGSSAHMLIDAPTRASLELTRSTSGDRKSSLLAAIDRTVTGPGARELAARLASPLRDVPAINARLDALAFLHDAETLREDVRRTLRHTPDLARAMSRLALQRGGPRDLAAIRDSLAAAQACVELLRQASGASPLESGSLVGRERGARRNVPSPLVGEGQGGGDSPTSDVVVPPTPSPSPQGGGESRRGCGQEGSLNRHRDLPGTLARIAERLGACDAALQPLLARALIDEPPHLKRDGGFVREGCSADLDAARSLRDDSRKVMAALEARYARDTGIKSLKVRHNNILGYYVEVPAGAARPLSAAPLNEIFRHRQTMAGAMRFTTQELAETESRIVSAADRALSLEQDIFAELASAVAAEERALGAVAGALAELDCQAGLAEVAAGEGYTRPVMDDSGAFEIVGGRHPVVEQALRSSQEGAQFIENDCALGDGGPQEGSSMGSDPQGLTPARLWLVTGPNMAGKSTFLRQNALIAVLAQMGAFVPARSARIGIVDRLFSRVGAADDLARGRSTFMVEMVETAGILNQASASSLVILDEIGRGTATYDGLSIAWAVVEYLHEFCKCRALFATHYHELTGLAGRLAEVASVTMEVREWKDDIVFLHKVKPGAADRSYGIQVAKLAGLPAAVTKRAAEVLRLLEKTGGKPATSAALIDDLPLFAAALPSPRSQGDGLGEGQPRGAPSPVEEALAALNPDELTPKEALEALYRLKGLSRQGD
jgi:DNA mismatch repair protein MutS